MLASILLSYICILSSILLIKGILFTGVVSLVPIYGVVFTGVFSSPLIKGAAYIRTVKYR